MVPAEQGPRAALDEGGDEVLGARISWRPVADTLPGGVLLPRMTAGRLCVTDDQLWFEDDLVRVLVRGTDEIWLDPRPGVERATVAHYGYGFGASAVLLHAGRFFLHASAVGTPDGVLVVAGDSGAGKSTTCMALAGRGARLLVDDLSPLRPVAAGVVLEPFARPVHLLDDAVDRLGLARGEEIPTDGLRGPTGKSVFRVPADVDGAPQAVRRITVLAVDEKAGPRPEVRWLVGAERMRHLVRHSNVTGAASFGRRAEPYFSWVSAVADRVEVVEIRRAPDVDSLEEVLDIVTGSAASG